MEFNYFTKNKLAFSSKSQLLEYIGKSLLMGEKEFYFRLDGKLKQAEILKEITSWVTKVMLEKGANAVRIRHGANDPIGTYWIKVNG